MAEKELEITITYENDNFFKMEAKWDAEEKKLIVKMEENGHLKELWPHIVFICKDYFASELVKIGKEMKV